MSPRWKWLICSVRLIEDVRSQLRGTNRVWDLRDVLFHSSSRILQPYLPPYVTFSHGSRGPTGNLHAGAGVACWPRLHTCARTRRGAGLYKFQVAMSSVTVLGLLYAARFRMRTCHAVCRPPRLAPSTATDAIHNVPSAAAAQHVVCLVNVARCTSACDARLT